MWKYLFAVLILLFFSSGLVADTIKSDLDFILMKHARISQSDRYDDSFTVKNVSEFKTFATGLIKLYQLGISSQDKSVCNFVPSCSRFTMQAMRQKGFIFGGLLGADRLMRCHRYSRVYHPHDYDIYHGHGFDKLYDPVEKYIR